MSKPADVVTAAGPASVPARKGRAAAKKLADPLKVFTYLVAAPGVLVYIAICVLVLVTLHLMTSEINRVDDDRGRKAMAAAFGSLRQFLTEQVADEATWTEAYLNVYIDFNPAWLDGTWGATARADGHYDTVAVTDAKGTILFGESSVGPLTGSLADIYSGAAEMLAALDAGIDRVGDDAAIADYARSKAGPAVVAAAVVHGSSDRMTVPAGDRRILWLGKSITAELANDVAHRFQIPVPALLDASMTREGPDETVMPLVDAAGAPVANLVWRPLRPGDAAFLHVAGIGSVALLILGALIFAVLTAFRRSVERRAESDERDWLRARYDPTTGLVNRFGLEESIRGQLAKPNSELGVAIACIEFDGLKEIAGSYGQQTSEALLDRVADLLDAGLDRDVYIARLAADEFALCRTGEGAGRQVRRCARIALEIVSDAIALEDLRLKLTASIGIGEAVVDRKTVGMAIDMAGAARQHAHELGGGLIVEHDSSLEESRRKRLALQTDIRRGLEAGEFDLVYQPIFDVGSQKMLGVEALLRWPRRAAGPMGPGEFIPAAEASGLIEELGLYALRQACREIAPYADLKLSVNVSTVQFRSASLATQIDSIARSAGFPYERLQLEITESFLLAQPERAKTAIEELRGRGIAIALDDFGTGFSSVGYLRQFSFDRVKLDRSLVADVDVDPAKVALVESTMVFAFAMGLAVTAEGVERPEEARTLTRLGCREFQGYYFSRPLTLEALARLLGTGQMKKAG